MKPYRNITGKSGVQSYDYGDDWIEVRFKSGENRNYRYESSKIGTAHLETMKRMADAGIGLNAYINSNPAVARGYSNRW